MKNNRYLSYVRELPCCHCQAPAEPHHIIGVGMGKMGGKASDIHTMPLCRECHDKVHRDPKAWPQLQWLLKTQEQAIRDGML